MLQSVIRWTARVIAALMFLLIGFIVATHIFGDQEEALRSLNTIIPMAMILVGLIIAWKWELIGGLLILCGCLIFGINKWLILLISPYGVCAIAAILFIISWLMHRKPKQPVVET